MARTPNRSPNTSPHAKHPQPPTTGLPSLTQPRSVAVLSETRLSVCQAAERLPGSNGATTAARQTIGRWINRGVKLRDGSKLKLEAVLVGGKWWTSWTRRGGRRSARMRTDLPWWLERWKRPAASR